jgi:hypothetical protein
MSNPIITAQDQFIAAFSAIDGTGNYETTVKKVYQEIQKEVPEYPSLAIVFARPQQVKVIDSAMGVFNMALNYGIACYIQSDSDVDNGGDFRIAQYQLFADIYRLIVSINKTYVNASPSWIIDPSVDLEMSPVEPLKQNQGIFGISGKILLRSLNGTLT